MNEPPENSTSNGPELDTDIDTLDYLRGVKSSTCLLLPTTPSPTPLDFKHPLEEEVSEAPFLTLNDEPNNVDMQNSDACAGDSSSSGDSNSVVQDPVSAQLINNISMLDYQTLSKNADLIMGPAEDCKLNGNLNFENRKLPSFVNWNWPVIRKVLLWLVLSGLVACLAAILAMVITIPKVCNPDLPWYQGKVFYEIFPAMFKDSDGDGTGDLKGLIKELDYIHGLGASAVRLNSIFEASDYPERYFNVTSLLNIDGTIGNLKDFRNLVKAIHERQMSLILDIPVISLVDPLVTSYNTSHVSLVTNNSLSKYDQTSVAIAFWSSENVDGFYLKNLERFVDNANFGRSLQFWKHLIGSDKILMASEKAYLNSKSSSLNVLLSRVDLIDVHLNLNNGIKALKDKIDSVISGPLWSKPHYPWVHWNIGNIDSERIATRHVNNSLALTVLEFVLPGTVSIFYGDEIGLGGLASHEIEEDFYEYKHTHNLVPMSFSNAEKDTNNNNNIMMLHQNSNSVLKPNYEFLHIVRGLTELRLNTPTIYLRAIFKEGSILKNTEVRSTEDNLVVIERWYPRRNTCVFVGNLGSKSITTDLSTMFYGGTVVAGTNASLVGQVLYFNKVTFPPNSAIVIRMEK